MASLYGLPARSFERHLVAGDRPHAAPKALARFAEAGAQHVAVFVTSDDPLVQFEDLAGEFAGLLASRPAPQAAHAADRAGPGPEDLTSVGPGGARLCRSQRYTGRRPGSEVRSSCDKT